MLAMAADLEPPAAPRVRVRQGLADRARVRVGAGRGRGRVGQHRPRAAREQHLLGAQVAPLSPRRRAWCYASIVVGLAVMVGGARSSLEDLISSSAGLFAGECRLEYAYSPTSPDDPCYAAPASTFGNSSSTGGTALR